MGGYTGNLRLYKPHRGEAEWYDDINQDLDLIDYAVGDIRAQIDDLPAVYIYTGVYEGSSGVVVNLPIAVGTTSDYGVSVISITNDQDINDIFVEKSTTSFRIRNSANNSTDSYQAIVYYKGDQNAYGLASFREWIVSVDAGIDHGDSGTTGSIAWAISQAAGNMCNIKLPGTHTYTLEQNLTVPVNITLCPDRGAIIDPGSYDVTLTINGKFAPAGGIAQYFDVSDVDQVVFGDGAIDQCHPEWWGAVSDGSTDCYQGIQSAINSIASIGGTVKFISGDYLIDTGVEITTNSIHLEGHGQESIIITDSAIDMILVYGTGDSVPDGSPIKDISIRNLQFYGTDGATIGVGMDIVRQSEIVNCLFNRIGGAGSYSIKLGVPAGSEGGTQAGKDRTSGITIADCWLRNNYATGTMILDGYSSQNVFTRNEIQQSDIGLHLVMSDVTTVLSNEFGGCNTQLKIETTAHAYDAGKRIDQLAIMSCLFENAVDYCIYIDSDNTQIKGITLRGNSFYSKPAITCNTGGSPLDIVGLDLRGNNFVASSAFTLPYFARRPLVDPFSNYWGSATGTWSTIITDNTTGNATWNGLIIPEVNLVSYSWSVENAWSTGSSWYHLAAIGCQGIGSPTNPPNRYVIPYPGSVVALSASSPNAISAGSISFRALKTGGGAITSTLVVSTEHSANLGHSTTYKIKHRTVAADEVIYAQYRNSSDLAFVTGAATGSDWLISVLVEMHRS